MANIDPSQSVYHEREDAEEEFTPEELRRMRLLLRRMRFLEKQINESGGLASPGASGGAAFAEWELEALQWVLTEMDYLEDVA